VRFLAGEERIAEDGSVEITSEDVLDLAGDAQLGRSDQWQFCPIPSEVVTGPKSPLVTPSALGLHIRTYLSRFLAPVSLSLGDVVIPLAADNLAPQSELSCAALECQSLREREGTLRDLKMR
jgi:hypothetical protein